MHIGGGMGVGVYCEAGLGMTKDSGQGLGVHSVRQRMGGKGMAQIVKPKVRQTSFLQDGL